MHAVSRTIKRRLSGPLLLAALGLAAAVSPASALAAGRSSAVGHVYLNDNTASVNTIAAFDRHADGSLTALPGSPFPAGGSGTGSGLASQGAVQLSSDGRFLLAVDAGSNQISVLRVKHDGSLKPVARGAVASGGLLPEVSTKLGRRTHDISMEADDWEHLADRFGLE